METHANSYAARHPGRITLHQAAVLLDLCDEAVRVRAKEGAYGARKDYKGRWLLALDLVMAGAARSRQERAG